MGKEATTGLSLPRRTSRHASIGNYESSASSFAGGAGIAATTAPAFGPAAAPSRICLARRSGADGHAAGLRGRAASGQAGAAKVASAVLLAVRTGVLVLGGVKGREIGLSDGRGAVCRAGRRRAGPDLICFGRSGLASRSEEVSKNGQELRGNTR